MVQLAALEGAAMRCDRAESIFAEHGVRNMVRALLHHAPVILWCAPGSNTRLLLPRPVDDFAVRSMAAMAAAASADVELVKQQYLAAAGNLHYNELVQLCPDQQSKRILNYVVQQLVIGRRAASRLTEVAPSTLAANDKRMKVAFIELQELHDRVSADIQQQVSQLEQRQFEIQKQLSVAQQIGLHADASAKLQRESAAVSNKLTARTDTDSHRFRGLLRLKMQHYVKHVPALWNKLRGHNPSAVVRHPNFVKKVEAAVQELQARTHKKRDNTTIIFTGKSSWAQLAKMLSDPQRMADLGGAIQVSASCLKNLSRAKHKAEPVLKLSSRKVLKIELPDTVQQPNAHMLNAAIRDLEWWALKNPGERLLSLTQIITDNN